MGSNLIVIGTLIFLFVSAVLLTFMFHSMRRYKLPPPPSPLSPHPSVPIEPIGSGISLRKPAPTEVTVSLIDIQDFINAKAEIIYNERAYTLDSDFYKIGRDVDCNLRISDKSVSRSQCAIEYHDNVFMLSDLNSKHGTYVNGEPAKEPIELHDGDEIRMGYAVMIFKRYDEHKADEGGTENPSPQAE